MEGKRTIQSIRLRNLLSFGSEGVEIELQPLNVLIGPNASGKSNFIEVLRLMSYLPRNIGMPISDGGGINEWLWKGGKSNPIAEIETLFAYPQNDFSLRHCLKFTGENNFAKIVHETISRENPTKHEETSYSYQNVGGQISWRRSTHALNHHGQPVTAVHADLDSAVADNQSILQQRKEPQLYPELYYLTELLPTFRLYDDFDVRRYSKLRLGQDPNLPGDFLEPNGSNLGVVLINIGFPGRLQHEISAKIKDITPMAEEVSVRLGSGVVQFSLQEQGLYSPIPPIRLSGGTLRYLCLLTILLHPTPPPLICLEEPEIGLHPDVIHKVAELLVEASKRTQIIVTTHSEQLVSALSDVPEAVIVCERDQDGTHLQRLDAESLKEWLEDYSLGDLWRKGELGGTRW